MDTGTSDLLFERRGPVGWLTFNRPDTRNAMTFAMYDGLAKVCEAVAADPEIRVLVLTGAGERAFVAGTDISQFQTFTNPEHALDYEKRVDRSLATLEALALPTIAMVRGYAVGGGASISLCCDMRICTPDAKWGIPTARTLGNSLSMNSYARLVDLIGPARAKHMIFTAGFFEAEDARIAGIVNEIVAPEEIEARTMALAEQIAGHAPLTIQVTKEAIRRILVSRRAQVQGDDLVVKAYMSRDFQEGVRAFLDKRKPAWEGH
jgi:enoyl-CoA hydratase/carnithine racemase